jgi:nicotinate-nucleotide--dimethylbenzimidazole phosphoribosyltransferase
MAGVCLGAAGRRLAVVVDGFISTSAAMVACHMASVVRDYLFLSHRSQERAHVRMLEHLGQEPLLVLELRLGEGTGAALALSIVEASAKILSEMATFSEAGVSNRGG